MARLRMIAGPNGSGKTTLTAHLLTDYQLDFGYYINADEIERQLRLHREYSFVRSPLKITEDRFLPFYKAHPLFAKAQVSPEFRSNVLYLAAALPPDTYFPTLLTDFLRNELIRENLTFSFETVMSDSRKVELLEQTRKAGYRNYLYYICTKDPMTNTDRVKDRVQKNGHDVPEEKILSRYQRSLENLLPAMRHCDRAYLFDNSGPAYELVAELHGEQLELTSDDVPNWLETAVLNKL